MFNDFLAQELDDIDLVNVNFQQGDAMCHKSKWRVSQRCYLSKE